MAISSSPVLGRKYFSSQFDLTFNIAFLEISYVNSHHYLTFEGDYFKKCSLQISFKLFQNMIKYSFLS